MKFYTATACAGNDFSMFPTTNLFAAAGEGIWENGAACGRQYLVRCFSSNVRKACVTDQTIQVTIVDRAISTVSKPAVAGTTMLLSTTAYKSIVKGAASLVSIEFTQWVVWRICYFFKILGIFQFEWVLNWSEWNFVSIFAEFELKIHGGRLNNDLGFFFPCFFFFFWLVQILELWGRWSPCVRFPPLTSSILFPHYILKKKIIIKKK